jgi:uncharacterized protein YecT (DUF1311 family)
VIEGNTAALKNVSFNKGEEMKDATQLGAALPIPRRTFVQPLLFVTTSLMLACNVATAGARLCEQEGHWACAGEDAARADRALNVAYKDAMLRLSGERKIKLRAEQRDWIKRRDKQCSANAINQGQIFGCEQDLTIERTAEIQRL